MKIPRQCTLIFAVLCLSLWVVGCAPKETAETVDRLPAVESIAIVKDDPLCIRVAAFRDAGDIYIKKSGKPRTLLRTVNVWVGDTFVVHSGSRTAYEYTLEGMQDGVLRLSVATIKNDGLPQNSVQLVEPYAKRK